MVRGMSGGDSDGLFMATIHIPWSSSQDVIAGKPHLVSPVIIIVDIDKVHTIHKNGSDVYMPETYIVESVVKHSTFFLEKHASFTKRFNIYIEEKYHDVCLAEIRRKLI